MNQGIMALASAGRGEDTRLAHLMEGEVVLPPHFLNNNKTLKNNLERNLAKTGTQLSDITVGSNTSSINPYTGLEEFGFLSKLWKKVKKVIDPVAQVARFIPGPWQVPANIYVKGKAAVNIVKGEGGIGDLATLFTGNKVLGEGGDLATFREFGFKGAPGVGGYNFDTLRKGVGSLFGGGSQEYVDKFGNKISQSEFENITSAAEKSMYKPVSLNIFQRAGDFIGGLDGTPGFQLSDITAGIGALRGGIQDATGIDPALAIMAKKYGDAYERALEKQQGGMKDVRESIRPDLQYTPYGSGGFDLGFAEGGAVMDMREGGESVGPGTGTSDDIPAMLSDGEFVMTAKANRGAGAVGLREGQGGIMEIVPNLEPDRQRGADNMMKLMRYFEALA
jgi:hypothetical protein